MADIVEVVHKINYEVDDRALQQATNVIRQQVSELSRLSKLLDGYNRQVASMASAESKAFDDILSKLNTVNGSLEASASKMQGILKEVFQGLAKGVGFSDGLKEGVSKYVGALKTQLTSLQDVAHTTGNKINATWTSTTSMGTMSAAKTASSLAGLAGSLASVTGLVDIGINLLITFSDELKDSSERIGILTTAVDALNAINIQAASTTAKVSTEMSVLKARFFDASATADTKRQVMEELNTKYGDTIGHLGNINDAEKFFVERSDAFVKAMTLRAQVQGAYNLIAQNQQKLLEAQSKDPSENVGTLSKLWAGTKAIFSPSSYSLYTMAMPGNMGTVSTYNNYIQEENGKILKKAAADNDTNASFIQKFIIQLQNQITALDKENHFNFNGGGNTQGNGRRYYASHYAPPKEQPPKLNIKLTPPDNPEEGDAFAAEIAKHDALKNALKEIKQELASVDAMEHSQLTSIEQEYAKGLLSYEKYQEEKTTIAKQAAENRLKIEIAGIKHLLDNKDIADAEKETYKKQLADKELELLQASNSTKHDKEEKTAADKTTAEEKRQQRIKDTIKAYQDLAAEAVKAINTIYDAQMKVLDNEIRVREKRVEVAKKLAERGNTEALRLEEERLAASQKKKEEYAKREAQLNAALAFSNSLVAVTGAIASAVKGDGYSLAARVAIAIAAVLGALASGYAFVQSFKSDGAFADGVVDYKGRGGPRDDANWVRISSGESVITANGTKRNRALLEAINKGAEVQLLNPALAYTMPVFASPQTTATAYASQYDLKAVENKLDNVVNAIEDNRLKQNIYFNEYGVGIMTERAIRKDRKRWM